MDYLLNNSKRARSQIKGKVGKNSKVKYSTNFAIPTPTDAIALSLGENISEPASALDSTSESNSGTDSKPQQQQPNVLESEKDDPDNPR